VHKGKLSGSLRRWLTKDMVQSIKAGNEVLNPMPLSEFNPSIGHVVKSDVDKALSFDVKDMASGDVKENPKDKTEISKKKPKNKSKGVTDKAPCVDTVKDKVSNIVKEKPKDKPKGVTDKAPCVDTIKDKVSDIVKEKRKTKLSKDKPKDKAKSVVKSKVLTELPKDKAKDKLSGKPPGDAVNDKALDVINEKRKTEVMKDKPKDKASSVFKDIVLADVTNKPVDVVKDKPEVVKERCKTELPKDKPKGKVPSVVKSKDKHKDDLHKDKPKPKDKHNVDSKVPGLRLKSKCKPEVKAKAFVRVLKSNKNVKRKRILSKENHVMKLILRLMKLLIESQKMKTKAELKRKRKGGLDSDSMSIDEEKVMRMLKKLKKIKKEDSDEESGLKSKKKGKKKEKSLTSKEAAHEEYLRLSLDTSDYVEVTPSKIHDILGIHVGGDSFFSLDARPIEHDFVRLWADQFYPKELKDIRVGDIASKLVFAQEVDFLFKVNFLTLFTNTMGRVAGLKGQICLDVARRLREDCVISKIDWCGYIHSCIEDSKLSKKTTVHYLGPFTHHYLMRKASSVYPGYVKFVELQEKYIQVFRDPISFDVDGDLFGQNLVTMEVLNQGPLTPDRMPTRASKVSPSPEKRIVKPSSYMYSRVILNHEERFLDAELKARHFFPTGCITKSMFDETLASVDDKWKSFLNQVKAQFKGNEGGLALEGIDLIKMFARHLKLYGHNWHAQVASLKHKIPKLKWSTKGNFHETPGGSIYWEPHVNAPMMILKIINRPINISIPTFHTTQQVMSSCCINFTETIKLVQHELTTC
nr:hypothetical protein [Tanacetum cinerariifolium]